MGKKDDPPKTRQLFLCEILAEEFFRLHGWLFEEHRELKERFDAYVELQKETINSHINDNEPDRSEHINRTLVPKIREVIHALPTSQPRAALCLSGGGIRSATFGLGVIQGLARSGLLHKFDYLSTVSGGGFIGSWLSAWIYRKWQRLGGKAADRDESIRQVEMELWKPRQDPLEPEPPEIKNLRAYSHYLAPRAGFLSADTWSLLGIYLRNLLINWTMLLPLLVAVLMIPRLGVAAVKINPDLLGRWPVWLLGGGLLFGAWALIYMGVNRPSSSTAEQEPEPGTEEVKGKGRGQIKFLGYCLLPLILSGVCLTTSWAWISQLQAVPEVNLGFAKLPSWQLFMIFALLLHLLGFVGYSLWLGKWRGGEFGVVVAAGLIGGGLAWLAISIILPEPITGIYVTLALPLFVAVFLLAATLFVGLVSRWTDDVDREWFGRAGSWMLMVIACWSAVSALVIFGPLALLWSPRLLVCIGGLSGLFSTLMGWSAKTAFSKEGPQSRGWTTALLNHLMGLGALVFLMVFIACLSLATSWLLQYLPIAFDPADPQTHLAIINSTPFKPAFRIFCALIFLALAISYFMFINKFSMHAMYRIRLIRAYLGASRPERKPNRFTGFDPDDNIEMGELLPKDNPGDPAQKVVTQGNKLLHMVNTTLNLVSGHNLAWQQRKGASFTVSPLHCGSYRLGYRRSQEYGKYTTFTIPKPGARSDAHGGHQDDSITLGNAVSISGAGVSPNMGYYSSLVVGFLLTLFNLRLGCWLGNPGPKGQGTYRSSGPRGALWHIIKEAFGLTDEESSYVFLSDGGHFDNLGLYEMVLRRCRFIVLSDAGCDPKFKFDDLGVAIHKIRVDFGIPIEFEDGIDIHPWGDKDRVEQRKHYAIARIGYSQVDCQGPEKNENLDGFLIYIKPAICGDEPVDILNYRKAHEEFPHETTLDQFYSETQFESYRMLGLHSMTAIINSAESEGFAGLVESYVKDHAREK